MKNCFSCPKTLSFGVYKAPFFPSLCQEGRDSGFTFIITLFSKYLLYVHHVPGIFVGAGTESPAPMELTSGSAESLERPSQEICRDFSCTGSFIVSLLPVDETQAPCRLGTLRLHFPCTRFLLASRLSVLLPPRPLFFLF